MSTFKPSQVHLVVIVHGLWGTPEHVNYLANTLARVAVSSEAQLEILCPSSIQWTHTYDGIDFCAERVAQEVDERRAQLEKTGQIVTRFSCVGYSLGGLIARFLVGLLHSRTPSFFEDIEPMNFTTFASPWIGIPNYGGLVGSTVHFFGSRMLSRTGNQLYLIDKFFRYPNSPKAARKYPLVALLAHPETNFYKALTKFKSLRIYANAINDRTVPFVTGAAEKLDGFQLSKNTFTKFFNGRPEFVSSEITELNLLRLGGLEITLDPHYPALIKNSVFIQDAVPPTALLEAIKSKPISFYAKYLPALPFFLRPASYPFRAPYNYVVVVVSPILVPAFLIYLLSSFFYQSRKSRQRIKLYSVGDLSDHSQRTKRVGLFEVEQEMLEEMAGLGSPGLDGPQGGASFQQTEVDLLDNGRSTATPPNVTTNATTGTNYSLEITESTSLEKLTKGQGLSQIQLEMLDNINRLPGLVKYFSFFDGVANSHGAIIYRAQGLSDERGQMVGKHWAERFLV